MRVSRLFPSSGVMMINHMKTVVWVRKFYTSRWEVERDDRAEKEEKGCRKGLVVDQILY